MTKVSLAVLESCIDLQADGNPVGTTFVRKSSNVTQGGERGKCHDSEENGASLKWGWIRWQYWVLHQKWLALPCLINPLGKVLLPHSFTSLRVKGSVSYIKKRNLAQIWRRWTFPKSKGQRPQWGMISRKTHTHTHILTSGHSPLTLVKHSSLHIHLLSSKMLAV